MSRRPIAVLFLAVLLAGPAPAVLPSGPKERAAVQKAAAYFKGVWEGPAAGGGEGKAIGPACLAGLALLEADGRPADPAVQAVAAAVREAAVTELSTYRVALAIMFLDRLGDTRDEPLIQVLGVRLYAGLNVAAGWGYNTWAAVPADEAARLRAVLAAPGHKPGRLHPEAVRQYQAVLAGIAATGRKGVGDDNSNTQFGLVGLWVAGRHGLPVDDAVGAIEARFLFSQNRLDGGWGYTAGAEGKSTPAMTCAGLLALAAGAARATKPAVRVRPADAPLAGPADDPFFNPHKEAPPAAPDAAPPPPAEPPPGKAPPPATVRDVAARAALLALANVIAGTPDPAGEPLSAYTGAGNKFYLLWSVERALTALGLDTLGGLNWYEWGSRHILPAQGADGAFGRTGGGIIPVEANTAFAVLFLCKTNLVGDLTGRIRGKIQDPKRAELRGGGGPGLFAPQRPEPARPAEPPPEPVLPPGTLPELRDLSDAVLAMNKLLAAKDEEWPDKLVEVRESQGVMQTLGLAGAIPRLTAWKRKQARDALADRLARMTPATLRGLLRDADPELRRAAALACGKKDDKGHIPDLIDRLTDPVDDVSRAARASLRALTGQGFGPDAGASPEAKAEAATAWKAWFDTRSR